jgi:hypothetical protein
MEVLSTRHIDLEQDHARLLKAQVVMRINSRVSPPGLTNSQRRKIEMTRP